MSKEEGPGPLVSNSKTSSDSEMDSRSTGLFCFLVFMAFICVALALLVGVTSYDLFQTRNNTDTKTRISSTSKKGPKDPNSKGLGSTGPKDPNSKGLNVTVGLINSMPSGLDGLRVTSDSLRSMFTDLASGSLAAASLWTEVKVFTTGNLGNLEELQTFLSADVAGSFLDLSNKPHDIDETFTSLVEVGIISGPQVSSIKAKALPDFLKMSVFLSAAAEDLVEFSVEHLGTTYQSEPAAAYSSDGLVASNLGSDAVNTKTDEAGASKQKADNSSKENYNDEEGAEESGPESETPTTTDTPGNSKS